MLRSDLVEEAVGPAVGTERYVGIDVGAESLKVVEVARRGEELSWTRRECVEHGKAPATLLREILVRWDWTGVTAAAACGTLTRQLALPRVPVKAALTAAWRFLGNGEPVTILSMGSRGFCVLEFTSTGIDSLRGNSRCSQGTGNFLRQLVERFGLTIEEASRLCADVGDPLPLSGRCPVILKTDMTHLANKGEARARILAGLFDAVCENVQTLIRPRRSPPRTILIGGVTRSPRVRENFRRFLGRAGMALSEEIDEEEGRFLEALGSAIVASRLRRPVPTIDGLFRPPAGRGLSSFPSLSTFLGQVRRMQAPSPANLDGALPPVVLGLDIGSTGSKAVAITASRQIAWSDYVGTSGDPVRAAQALVRRFLHGPAGRCPVIRLGATGSGREIVGSLAATCYGARAVHVLNEIAAHAAGAVHYDARVDTIFEIGGQDAKYIRLTEGRVTDAAMNEACSAGTGSFIEEQGRKFPGIRGVEDLSQAAVGAQSGVSLGQHCSVFMAEFIDDAFAAGVEARAIVAGLFDSVVQNYLNRVKGSRSVGRVIFCQGMPFASDALAAAVVRQTGSEVVVPPSPGTVGALGIALLALREIPDPPGAPMDLHRFLDARVDTKTTFVCRSTRGCGGAGNRCRIDRLATVVAHERKSFTWGGSCSLHDRDGLRRKLPHRSPDPFRERDELVQRIAAGGDRAGARPRLAITDEFVLKGLFPFFGTYLDALGFDLVLARGAEPQTLKRGIENARVPFCAPMQLYHGLADALRTVAADVLFLPMLRSLPRAANEPVAVTCPIVQASPDILRAALGNGDAAQVLSPVIDIGRDGFRSPEFLQSCRGLARQLGVRGDRWREACQRAVTAQEMFDEECLTLGRRALAFASAHAIPAVVVVGRAYTIHNRLLNSNVPAILREQGVMAVPLDCYPVNGAAPVIESLYWGHGHRAARAAHEIRRAPGVYGIFCSNYACGPDSFGIHFFSHLMQGKPFAIIETDGHSGDAGTKTRVEAFLHCVRQDLEDRERPRPLVCLENLVANGPDLADIRGARATVVVPSMGPSTDALAACLRGAGIPVHCLPAADADSVRLGRRHTSGKECVPFCVTLGSLLQRVPGNGHRQEPLTLLMPASTGPCRFGLYHLLHRLILDRLGLGERVKVWAPSDSELFAQLPGGISTLLFTGVVAVELLAEALRETRPTERCPGAAVQVYERHRRELLDLLEREASRGISLSAALRRVATGDLFGCRALLERAAGEFAAARNSVPVPTILVVGEIFARLDPLTNDFVVEKLEDLGLRVRLAPASEWLEYLGYLERDLGLGGFMTHGVERRVARACHEVFRRSLGLPAWTSIKEILSAARPYVREEIEGEAVLTVGKAVHAWRAREIDGVVVVGPLECMPNKVAECQLTHAAEREGLPFLALSFNGDPTDRSALEDFAFELHERFSRRQTATPRASPSGS
jgi:predicted CoA-substrate-specific enzyme activase